MAHTDPENETGNGTFPFLQLPTEIRVMIYHHHLTSKRIETRWRSLTGWTPINLLYVSRTIYNEAFFHLYTKGEFVLDVRPHRILGLATYHEMRYQIATVALETFVKSPKILGLIRHIALDVHWPSVGYSKLTDRLGERSTFPTRSMFEQTMAKVGAMLSDLPALRTIDVLWFETTEDESLLIELAPPRYAIPVWLRGLKHVRRKNEKVLIRMPSESPISTGELARNQEDRDEVLDLLIEVREDVEALQGYLQEGAH